MSRTVGDIGEDALIAIFARPGGDLVVPNGDDAAAWAVPEGETVVATTDSLVEGVHFRLDYAVP